MPYLLQLGGALKNPLAVGAGMIEGMGFGINTMAERAPPRRSAPRRIVWHACSLCRRPCATSHGSRRRVH
jgi:hypothetical protein